MMKTEYAAASSVGMVRGNNEDNFFANGRTLSEGEAVTGTADEIGLFAVCDGMGGEEYGEVASAVAVQTLAGYYGRILNGKSFDELCRLYVDEANAKVCAEMEKHEGVRIGTTLALLWVADSAARICNIGDSRIYLLRDARLSQISIDHTQVRRMMDMGILTPEKARTHPQRHILTQHLGILAEEMLIEPYVSEAIKLRPNDVFLICSDGLTDMVEDADIEAILKRDRSAAEEAGDLVNAALRNGGKDNVTVIVVKPVLGSTGS